MSQYKATPVAQGDPLNPANILTPAELAKRLKVKVSWIYEKTRSRNRERLPFLRLGRYVRFDWASVSDWLTKQASKKT